jgi:collagenase-like PrtC family protease
MWQTVVRMGSRARLWYLEGMDADESASYLELSLQEKHAAREATSVEAREHHEKLAIAYEVRCLLSARQESAKPLAPAE